MSKSSEFEMEKPESEKKVLNYGAKKEKVKRKYGLRQIHKVNPRHPRRTMTNSKSFKFGFDPKPLNH